MWIETTSSRFSKIGLHYKRTSQFQSRSADNWILSSSKVLVDSLFLDDAGCQLPLTKFHLLFVTHLALASVRLGAQAKIVCEVATLCKVIKSTEELTWLPLTLVGTVNSPACSVNATCSPVYSSPSTCVPSRFSTSSSSSSLTSTSWWWPVPSLCPHWKSAICTRTGPLWYVLFILLTLWVKWCVLQSRSHVIPVSSLFISTLHRSITTRLIIKKNTCTRAF